MNKRIGKYLVITSLAAMCASVAYATDGAKAAWIRDSDGVLTSGIDSDGGLVVPSMTIAEGVTVGGTLDVTGVISGPGTGITGVALDSEVWGSAGITPSPELLVNTVAIQAKDIAAGDLSGYRVLHVWVAETDVGVASTNNIESLAMSTGTAVSTVTAHADYWYVTAAAGTATATVTGTAVGTNYLMVADGSVVSSSAITFVE